MLDGGLRQLLQERLRQVHWQSIETPGTGAGVPDMNGCYGGREFWVELKQTQGWAVTLRPHQVGWICRRVRAGGNVYVMVRRASDELWLLDGCAARELKVAGLRKVPEGALLNVWGGGPSRWNWDEILQILAR